MTIIATCGHVLTEHDGEDGMGHMLYVKGYSSECTPAIEYRCYCTKCSDAAVSEPGFVLHTDEEQLAWFRSAVESIA